MAAFDTYTALVSAIEDWLDRADLSGNAEQMVALAESRMRRELQPLLMETTATATASSGVVTIPADCAVIRHIAYDGGDLRQVSPQNGRQQPEGEEPRAFSLEAGGIYLWPATDVAVTITYQPKLVGISSTNPTNWLLTGYPDLYFYGAMMFAEGFLANDNRAALFKGLWDEALEEARTFLARQRKTGVRLPSPAVIA